MDCEDSSFFTLLIKKTDDSRKTTKFSLAKRKTEEKFTETTLRCKKKVSIKSNDKMENKLMKFIANMLWKSFEDRKIGRRFKNEIR